MHGSESLCTLRTIKALSSAFSHHVLAVCLEEQVAGALFFLLKRFPGGHQVWNVTSLF